MKLLKQITAVMAALLIVVNVSFINTSAAMAAPVMAGEELASFLAGALGASGHSQSEIDNLTIPDQLDLLGNDLRNGNISLDTPVTYETNIDGINQAISVPFDTFMGMSKDISGFNPPVYAFNWYKEAIDNFISDLSDPPVYFISTPTTDMKGYGVKVVQHTPNNGLDVTYGDCIILYQPQFGYYYPSIYNGFYRETYVYDSNTDSYILSSTFSGQSAYLGDIYDYVSKGVMEIYGDVRAHAESSPVPDFEVDTECRVGALPDGTVVTPDMLNPDGTVTVDGVTYDPVDYLDPDNLTDEGEHALIDAIADAISNTYVVADDKPIVDADDITIEVAEDLENFTVPKGIITVFPFCLPFDFVRGMKTLVQKPKVPVFKAELDLTDFCGYDLGKHTIEISFEKWEPAAVICRWFFILLFAYTLILLTPKICKGAG